MRLITVDPWSVRAPTALAPHNLRSGSAEMGEAGEGGHVLGTLGCRLMD